MYIPKLHFKYAYPLDSNRRQLFADKNFGPYPSFEEVRDKINKWRKVWDEINKDDKIFKSLIEVTGVHTPRDLEMHIYGDGLGAMSNPLIMPIKGPNGIYTDDEFLETAIHEVIHRFVGDQENNPGIKKYWDAAKKEYAQESVFTLHHIIVYAVLELVLVELFGKERLKDFMHPKHPDYQRAVAIVSEKGAKNLVKEFRGYLQ